MNRGTTCSILLTLALVVGATACSSDGGSDGATTATEPAAGTGSEPDEGGSATTEPTDPDQAATDEPTTVASAGCEGAAPAAGRTVETVESGGRERTYVRYVPEGLIDGEPAPLVVDVTAYSPASLQEDFSSFTKPDAAGAVKADEVGAVVVTPEPVNGAGALLTWNYVGTEGWTDDQAFLTDLLDDVEADACLDTDRVLAMGFAVGAVFASITTCGQAERIAVLATVAGLYSPEGCAPAEPIPVISFHGTGDRFVPYDGSVGSGPSGLGLSPETTAGLTFMLEREGAVASSAAWAAHDGCAPEPTEAEAGPGLTRTTWSDCDDDASVELYTIDGGEHTWPGSPGMAAYESLLGPVSDAVVANDVIWDFFETHTS